MEVELARGLAQVALEASGAHAVVDGGWCFSSGSDGACTGTAGARVGAPRILHGGRLRALTAEASDVSSGPAKLVCWLAKFVLGSTAHVEVPAKLVWWSLACARQRSRRR